VEFDRLKEKFVAGSSMQVAIKDLMSISKVQRRQDRFDPSVGLTVTEAFVEIAVMMHPNLSDHPNILRLLGTTDTFNAVQSSNLPLVSLVMEYADLGSLELFIHREQRSIDSRLKMKIISDIAGGLHSLHSCDIIHNDVKSSNILLFSSPSDEYKVTAKISDFGCSTLLAATKSIRRAAGTRLFAPPEAYREDCVVQPTRDVYSFGLVLLHLVTGSPPFDGMTETMVWDCKLNTQEMEKYIRASMRPRLDPISLKIMDILLAALRPDPEQRLQNLSLPQLNG